MIGLRGFLAGLAIVALVAAILAAPKAIKLGTAPELRLGSPGDTGPSGHSLLAQVLSSHGLRVGLSYKPPRDWNGSSLVYIVAGPTECRTELLQAVAEEARRLASQGLRVGVVIADEGPCGKTLLDMLDAPFLSTVSGAPSEPWLALYQGGEPVLYAMYSVPTITYMDEGWRQLAVSLYPRGLPAALEWRGSVDVVYIPDSHVFTNMVMSAANETGLGNAELAVTLVEKLGGADALVLMPLGFYRLINPSIPLVAYLQPGVIIIRLVEWLAGLEKTIVEAMLSNPLAATVLVIGVMSVLYIVFAQASGKKWAAEKPPEQAQPPRLLGTSPVLEKLQRGVELSRQEARQALAALYELVDEVLRVRVGAGLSEVLEDDRLLERLAREAGIDPGELRRGLEALHRLYTAKIREGRLLPLVVSWKRRLYYVLERVEPLLESIGAGLEEARSIEYSLAR
ncbi:hypothetical protein [Pyrodictium abyssi]|uniref:DUF4350 domain-containing protein n=1 Tax=Pyrodictium abyssi TaxID=54256 RepID=A0ABN6ZR17_9CREN|nr:hypothetical protein PABY_22730 [Pyrodictium abyssi]